MTRFAVDGHSVVAFGHVVHHALLVVQRVAELIEIGDLQSRAEAHRAGGGRKLPEQHAQKRGLARAVVADEAYLFAALNDDVRIFKHLVAVRPDKGHVLHLGHQLSRLFRLLHVERGRAHSFPAGGALLAHLHELAHAPHVAGAPRLDALAYPHFLLREFLVERGVLHVFRVQTLLAALKVRIEAAVVAVDLGSVELRHARGKPPYEGAVVADEHQRARLPGQILFQPADGADVQMVGGLVEKQHVRGDERPGQRHAAARSARKRGEVRLRIQRETVDDAEHFAVPLPHLAVFHDEIRLSGQIGRQKIAPVRRDEVRRGQQMPFLAESVGRHAEHRALPVIGHGLLHVAYAQPGSS